MDNITGIIKDFSQGKIVIVVDSVDRENEGDFVCAAEKITPEIVNFMVTHGRGLICCPITLERATQLNLSPMVEHNTCPLQTAFTVSVDAKEGLTTGISVFERSRTIKTLSKRSVRGEEFVTPGHIFPLVAHKRGLLGRDGHTEAGVELSRLAGLDSSAVICEILNVNGSMARLSELKQIAHKYQLKMISIKNIVNHIKKNN